jgi:hypothetical protein
MDNGLNIIPSRGTVASILRMRIFFQENALTDPTCTSPRDLLEYHIVALTNSMNRGIGQSRHLDRLRRCDHYHRSLSSLYLAVDRADPAAQIDEQALI